MKRDDSPTIVSIKLRCYQGRMGKEVKVTIIRGWGKTEGNSKFKFVKFKITTKFKSH